MIVEQSNFEQFTPTRFNSHFCFLYQKNNSENDFNTYKNYTNFFKINLETVNGFFSFLYTTIFVLLICYFSTWLSGLREPNQSLTFFGLLYHIVGMQLKCDIACHVVVNIVVEHSVIHIFILSLPKCSKQPSDIKLQFLAKYCSFINFFYFFSFLCLFIVLLKCQI